MTQHTRLLALIAAVFLTPAFVSAAPFIPRIESSTTPERSSPRLPFTPEPAEQPRLVAPQAAANAAETLGPNLIPNASLENGSTLPTSWHKGGYGTNARTLSYPVAGVGGSRGIGLTVTGYQSGDAKW